MYCFCYLLFIVCCVVIIFFRFCFPKLSGAYYAVRSVVHISNINTIKSVYFAYLHSVIICGIIFWVYSSSIGNIFTLQKKKYEAGAQPRTSCILLYKQLQILPVPCYYTHSWMSIINKQEFFKTNSSIHNINARNKHNLRRINATYRVFKEVLPLLA